MESNKRRILLVLDDHREIRRLFLRFLNDDFDEIHVHRTAEKAEEVLRSRPVTHLVIDHYLGEHQPLGIDLLHKWRREISSLRYSAIFSGSVFPEDIDTSELGPIFYKPMDFDDLVEALKSNR